MNNNLLIFGAGGHGRVVKEAAEALEIFSKIDFWMTTQNLLL